MGVSMKGVCLKAVRRHVAKKYVRLFNKLSVKCLLDNWEICDLIQWWCFCVQTTSTRLTI